MEDVINNTSMLWFHQNRNWWDNHGEEYEMAMNFIGEGDFEGLNLYLRDLMEQGAPLYGDYVKHLKANVSDE